MKEVINIGSHEVTIDPENLKFSEATLTAYIQMEAGYYDNFGAYLALAEKNLQLAELAHERMYAERFAEAKDLGGSDKLAECKSKADADVVDSKERVIEAKYKVKRLTQHLKAWDKNHDNAQSMGHMQRKLLDKMNSDIMRPKDDYDLDQKIDNSVTHVSKGEPEASGLQFEEHLSLANLY